MEQIATNPELASPEWESSISAVDRARDSFYEAARGSLAVAGGSVAQASWLSSNAPGYHPTRVRLVALRNLAATHRRLEGQLISHRTVRIDGLSMLPVMTGAAVPPETGRPSSVNIQALGLTVVLTCSTGTDTDHATQSAL